MANEDLSISVGADFANLDRAFKDIENRAKRSGKAVGDAFGQHLLEGERKVKRSLESFTEGVAGARTGTDLLFKSVTTLENAFKTSLGIGASVAAGAVLKTALEGAAKAADSFTARADQIIGKSPFKATAADAEKFRDTLAQMEQEAGGAGFLDRWLFGDQKESQIEAARSALDRIQQELEKKATAASGLLAGRAALQTQAAQSRASGASGENLADRLEFDLQQTEKLRHAQEELNKVLNDPQASEERKANAQAVYDLTVAQQEAELTSFNRKIERRQLDDRLAEKALSDAVDLMGILDEGEKLREQITQAEEKLAILSGARAATEKEIRDVQLEQARLKAALAAWQLKELDAQVTISKLHFERTLFGKTELDQQRARVAAAEIEAKNLLENAKNQQERQKAEEALNAAAKDRVALAQAERQEQEKLRDLAFQREQLESRGDAFQKAEDRLKKVREDRARTHSRKDASASEKAQADLEVAKAEQEVIQAAGGGGGGQGGGGTGGASELSEVADLRRQLSSVRGTDKASYAERARLRRQLAEATRSRNPYDAGTRDRADRMVNRSMIEEAKGRGDLPATLPAEEARRMEGMSKGDLQRELEKKRVDNERIARRADNDRAKKKWDREHPLDAHKRDQGQPYDSTGEPKSVDERITEESAPGSGGGGAGGGGDPMASIAASVQNIDRNVTSIEKKLPQNALK